MSDFKIAYLAGLVDGEGYVGIRRCTTKNDRSLIPEFKPTIVIANTNYDLMLYLKANYSGTICTQNRGKSNWKISYKFEFNRTAVKEILPEIIPYLVIKREQANKVMELFDTYKHTYPGFGYTESEVNIKENLHKQCLDLNKRGVTV